MKRLTIGILVLLAAVGIVFLIYNFSKTPLNTAGVINNPEENNVIINSNVIEITSSGFTPKILDISKGSRVTWINKDTEAHWPASAFHPTHKVYPGSDIEKCGTSEQSSIFDACRGLAPGESFSFTFNEAGSWGYHDHLDVNLNGKIVVE